MSDPQAQLDAQVDLWASLARDTGAEAALPSYADEWRRRVEQTIAELASSGRTFTADDVRHRAGDPPSPNALGAAMLRASRNGTIRFAGITRSGRIERHAGMLRTWVGAQVREIVP